MDGLVGGDEEEGADAGGLGLLGQGAGGEGVVAQGLDGVALHHGDVLVGGGVEEEVGAFAGEELAHQGAVAAVGHDGEDRGVVAALVDEGGVDLVEGGLGELDEDEALGAGGPDLAGELAADGAARAGDEDGLAAEGFAHGGGVDLALAAAEEVGDLNGAQLEAADVAAGEEAGQGEDAGHDGHARGGAEGDEGVGAQEGVAQEELAGHREGDGAQEAREVAQGDGARAQAVATEEEEAGPAQEEGRAEADQHRPPAPRRRPEVETQEEGRQVGDEEDEAVGQEAGHFSEMLRLM